MRRCQWESGSVIRAMGIATIPMDTAITRTGTTDLIDTMAITMGAPTTTGTATTDTIGIIATTTVKYI
jgi:hypothetical protein